MDTKVNLNAIDLLWVQVNTVTESLEGKPHSYHVDQLYERLDQIGLVLLLQGMEHNSHVRCIAKEKDRFKVGIKENPPYVCPLLTEELIREIELNSILGLPLSSLSVKDFWPVSKSEFINKCINQNKQLEYSIKWLNNDDKDSIMYFGVKL